MLIPAFTIYTTFIVLIYSYKLFNIGLSAITLYDYLTQLTVIAAFLLSILVSNVTKTNPILSIPSMVFLVNSIVLLANRDMTNIYIPNYDWLFTQIIAVLLVSFTGSARCNTSVFLFCVLSPAIAKIFNGNIQLASTYYEQSIIYFIAPITIYLSYLRAVQTIRHIEDLKKINNLQKSSILNQQIINHQEKLATVGMLTASIAHEINNPLTVLNYSNLKLSELLKSPPPLDLVAIENHVAKVAKSTEKIHKIASGLKIFSSKEKQKAVFNFNGLLKDNLEFLSVLFKNSQIEIHTSIDSNPLYIYGSEGEISQVITNLISNAKDAIEEAQSSIKKINIQTSKAGDHLVLKIEDSGAGIPDEIKKNIFTPFFTTKNKGKGLGLGMSITHNIVTEHDGEITFNSSKDGTNFILKFPLAPTLSGPDRN